MIVNDEYDRQLFNLYPCLYITIPSVDSVCLREDFWQTLHCKMLSPNQYYSKNFMSYNRWPTDLKDILFLNEAIFSAVYSESSARVFCCCNLPNINTSIILVHPIDWWRSIKLGNGHHTLCDTHHQHLATDHHSHLSADVRHKVNQIRSGRRGTSQNQQLRSRRTKVMVWNFAREKRKSNSPKVFNVIFKLF